MVSNSFSSGYVNVGGIPMGNPLTHPYAPQKHLELNSYTRVFGKENVWLGILNVLNQYNKLQMPFLAMTELSKNVLEVEGEGTTFTFGVPFIKGAPFLKENLCKDNPTPCKGNKPIFIVLSENVYTYGDKITNNFRNGKVLVIQSVQDRGEDAEIIRFGDGYRFMVALDSYSEDDYFPQEYLEPGTEFFKIGNDDRGEFKTQMSSYSGTMLSSDREALQLYQYTVGTSRQGIHGWVTADATYKTLSFDPSQQLAHPIAQNLKGATSDIMTYWGLDTKTNKKGIVFWIPTFIQKMVKELAAMKEQSLLWNQGNRYVSNGRETLVTGLGFYQQIKQRGNYDSYTEWDQLFELVMNFSEKLFTIHNQVSPRDRVVRLRAGRMAYTELRKRFAQHFKTDNPFTVLADHPALLKAGLLNYDQKHDGLVYKRPSFAGIYNEETGLLLVEHDPSIDRIDDYLEHPSQTSMYSTSSGMIFIEDITDGNFTNAIPTGLRNGEMKYKNTTMIKTKGWLDKIEFIKHAQCSDQLLNMLGIPNTPVVQSFNKGLEIGMFTEGEVWVQDPSRCWIVEYDPYGVLKQTNSNYSLNSF